MKVVVDLETMNKKLSDCLRNAAIKREIIYPEVTYLDSSLQFEVQKIIMNPFGVPANRLIGLAKELGVLQEVSHIVCFQGKWHRSNYDEQ